MKMLRIQLSVITVIAVLISSFPATVFAATTKEKLDQAEKEKQQLEEQMNQNEENLS